jgi:hypothetical protein
MAGFKSSTYSFRIQIQKSGRGMYSRQVPWTIPRIWKKGDLSFYQLYLQMDLELISNEKELRLKSYF